MEMGGTWKGDLRKGGNGAMDGDTEIETGEFGENSLSFFASHTISAQNSLKLLGHTA